jgi:23S rRNA pseudouridine1911/1915/1917 synthase
MARTARKRNFTPHRPIGIQFEDDSIIILDKPAGLLTIATETERQETAYAYLFGYIKSKRPPEKLFIVHRLDREASGLLVFAKSEMAKRYLQQQFREHSAGRVYHAVVQGRVMRNRQVIESYLAENAIHRSYSCPSPAKGKRAVTHVEVLKRSAQRTLLEVRLDTGRKHQIRVHLAEHGHPIVGDKAYGSTSNPIRRLALHAVKLSFKHPKTGETVVFESPAPPNFSSLI